MAGTSDLGVQRSLDPERSQSGRSLRRGERLRDLPIEPLGWRASCHNELRRHQYVFSI